MTVATEDLSSFLLARIAEDDDFIPIGDCRCVDGNPQRPDCADRIVAECEAKRRIVQDWRERHELTERYRTSYAEAREVQALTSMCRVAAVYADHPDYREEWRP